MNELSWEKHRFFHSNAYHNEIINQNIGFCMDVAVKFRSLHLPFL